MSLETDPMRQGNLTSNPKIGEASQSRALPHQQHYAKRSLDCSSMWKIKCQLVCAKGSGTLTKRDAFKKKEPLDTQGSSTKELCQSKPILHCISGGSHRRACTQSVTSGRLPVCTCRLQEWGAPWNWGSAMLSSAGREIPQLPQPTWS